MGKAQLPAGDGARGPHPSQHGRRGGGRRLGKAGSKICRKYSERLTLSCPLRPGPEHWKEREKEQLAEQRWNLRPRAAPPGTQQPLWVISPAARGRGCRSPRPASAALPGPLHTLCCLPDRPEPRGITQLMELGEWLLQPPAGWEASGRNRLCSIYKKHQRKISL